MSRSPRNSLPHMLTATSPTIYITSFCDRLKSRDYSKHTINAYRRMATRFTNAYPNIPLEKFTPEHVERHFESWNISQRSKSIHLEELRSFFTFLVKSQRLLKKNPCSGVEPFRYSPKIRPSPSREDFDALLRACWNPEETALISLLYFTGLRFSEFRSVRIRDVDLQNRRIRVLGKGKKERYVVFPEEIVSLLRGQMGRPNPDAWVFPGDRGFPRGENWVGKTLGRIGKDSGLPYRLTCHLLRHGFFRLLKTSEVPLEVAAKLGGHSNIQTTARIYGALSTDDLQAVYDRRVSGEKA